MPDGPGTIIDLASNTGVYEVSFSPTLAGTSFRILMKLNGLEIDASAEYRTNTLVVVPALNPSAANCNYTILPSLG
jgi:hypothetical protein